jgi:hypothetical protein
MNTHFCYIHLRGTFMRKLILIAFLFAALLALPAQSSAQIVGISGGGPGGIVYNPGAGGGPPGTYNAFLSTQFNAKNYIDLHVQVSGSGVYMLYQAPSSWSSYNNSTDIFSGMIFDNLSPQLGDFTNNFNSFTFWQDFGNKLTITSFSTTQVVFGGIGANGPVNPGTSFAPIGLFTANGPGEIVVRMTPIPEPSTILFGIGTLASVGIIAIRRRRIG